MVEIAVVRRGNWIRLLAVVVRGAEDMAGLRGAAVGWPAPLGVGPARWSRRGHAAMHFAFTQVALLAQRPPPVVGKREEVVIVLGEHGKTIVRLPLIIAAVGRYTGGLGCLQTGKQE